MRAKKIGEIVFYLNFRKWNVTIIICETKSWIYAPWNKENLRVEIYKIDSINR